MSGNEKVVDLVVPPVEDIPSGRPAMEINREEQQKAAAQKQQEEAALAEAEAKKLLQDVAMARINDKKRQQEQKRKDHGFTPHHQTKEDVMAYYSITNPLEPLAPEVNFHIITDMWDDLMVLNKIVKEDKAFHFSDGVEFGCGVLFGLIVLAGALCIASDTAMPSTADCTTTFVSGSGTSAVYKTECPVGASPLMQIGSWMTAFGSMLFIGVIMWRVYSRMKGGLNMSDGPLKFLEELITNADHDEEEILAEANVNNAHGGMTRKASSFLQGWKKKQDPAVQKPQNSRYMRAQYYAPRSAYHRAATKYGSPNMC